MVRLRVPQLQHTPSTSTVSAFTATTPGAAAFVNYTHSICKHNTYTITVFAATFYTQQPHSQLKELTATTIKTTRILTMLLGGLSLQYLSSFLR